MDGIVVFIIGMMAGVALSLVIMAVMNRNRKESARQEAEAAEQRYRDALAEHDKTSKALLDSQQARFDETLDKVTAQLKAATEDMLKQRQKEFAESSQKDLGQILSPLKEKISEMSNAMKVGGENQAKMSGQLETAMRQMMEQSIAARKSADELTRAFKHEGKVQGDWGEVVLNELLESQGLTAGIHYDVQPVINDGTLRPDIILHLDEQRDVVIDSKVSMTAYIEYVNAEGQEERERKLREHVRSIKEHVKELAQKDYSSYMKKEKMGYVIMFVPHTGALWTALNAQPDLWRNAMEQNVFIADEQTLYAALKMVNMTWTRIAQEQNHAKIFRLAEEMLERVGQFLERYKAIGTALDKARQSYEEGEKKLTTGQSVMGTCQKLVKMGAKESSRHPLPKVEEQQTLFAQNGEKQALIANGEKESQEETI